MTRSRFIAAAVLVFAVLGTVLGQAPPEIAPAPRPSVDLTGYRFIKDAVSADPKQFKAEAATGATVTAAGYLGILIGERSGQPVIDAVEPGSPADVAGLQIGDAIRQIDSESFFSAAAVRDALRSHLAGDRLQVSVERDGKTVSVAATLKATTQPMTANTARAGMGVSLGDRGPMGGVKVDDVTEGGAAAKAGMKVKDIIVKLDGKDVEGPDAFREAMTKRRPGDRADLLVERDGKRVELQVILVAEDTRGGRGGAGWDDRIPSSWRKPTYRLAILGIEYPDVKHNAKIADKDWEESMFSLGTYTGKSATGETVYGSMNDYYRELSYGTFKVEGKFLGWVEAKKKRTDYSTGSGTDTREKTALLTESLDLYVAKNGKDSLKDYDGIFFLYAGGRVQTTRGGLYWPHRANVTHNGKRWPYFIVQEGGTKMNDISVFCHEFGHMLGLPDLYARPEQPGSEGVWQWCAMSNQIGNGRPQHFCAWSKEQLGWIKPVVVDPRVKQKLVLSPIETDPSQCIKVMVRPDGSEYFLLENRAKKGWDAGLPAEGLLIWRVFTGSRGGQPVYLEESHGVEGSRGPSSFPDAVPFPSKANTAFTPYTIPSSKSQLGGGLPVFITNIRKLPDGRITFHIGYEYQ